MRIIDILTHAFPRTLYPGYVNRKVLDKKSFPLHDARVRNLIESNRAFYQQ